MIRVSHAGLRRLVLSVVRDNMHQKITAIKEVRELTGYGLIISKHLVEAAVESMEPPVDPLDRIICQIEDGAYPE